MKSGQRVVRSIPDRKGNPYTKTSQGGQARMRAAVRYMDERERTQLYTMEKGHLIETDRDRAMETIENTETRYQQHMAFTTTLEVDRTWINEREAAEQVARTIQERRPDAEIYAIAVHSDGKDNENGVHVHATFGTSTTLRHDDLTHFREKSYELERQLELEQAREISERENAWIQARSREKALERSQERELERN